MVAGKYLASGVIMGSDMETEIEYIVEGNTLTGTMVVMGTKIEVLEGTVDGDTFKHQCKVPTPMGQMKIKIDGKVEGDDISFIIKNPMGKSPFTGKRI